MELPRSLEQRKSAALAKLTAREADVWIASSSTGGRAHLVPLSFAWDGEHVIIAVEATALTARNIIGTGRARLALGTTRDVVMLDVALMSSSNVGDAPAIAERYAVQADWDPRAESGEYNYLLLRPERIQVWREANEIAGRTVMHQGAWLIGS